jgi:hypothetical protein
MKEKLKVGVQEVKKVTKNVTKRDAKSTSVSLFFAGTSKISTNWIFCVPL